MRHLNDFIPLKKASWGESVDNDAPFFSGRGGKHCQPITLMKSFKVAVKTAGLPERFSIHSASHNSLVLPPPRSSRMSIPLGFVSHAPFVKSGTSIEFDLFAADHTLNGVMQLDAAAS